MSRWFRFYDEALDDPKVQLLKPELFKAWVNLLCLASKNGGVLPPEEELCFALRLSQEKACELLNELMIRGLLDVERDVVRPHNWDRRQYKSDVSNERVKRFREKGRNGDVTLHETPPEAETDTESETDNNIGGGTIPREPIAAAADLKELQRRCEQATGLTRIGDRKIEAIAQLVADGFSLDDRILPLMRSVAAELRTWGKPEPATWAYFDKAVRDDARKVQAAEKSVEMVFIAKGSPGWSALVRSGKKEGYLCGMMKKAGDGTEGIYWPQDKLPALAH